jgi:predicted lipoprotein with Yx(FWY)xxD motif
MIRAAVRLRLIPLLALVALVGLGGCGGGDEAPEPVEAVDPAEEAREAERPERPEHPGTRISTSDSQFGEVLFDADDQAIYYFDEEDAGSRPECYGECAEEWPPVLTRGEPRDGGGAKRRLLGTVERRDGSLQVTYDGRPLYYYAHEGAGELRCHNVFHAGGLWLAVLPNGEPVPT